MFNRFIPCLAVIWFCCGLLHSDSVTALAFQDQQQVETASDSFHRNVIRSAVKAAKDGTITRRDVMKLRVAMLSPAFREQAYDLAIVQMAASGSESLGSDAVPLDEDGKIVETAVDWDKLLAFIEKLIPILLQLIDAFGYLDSIHIHVGGPGMPLYATVRSGSYVVTVSA